MQKRSILMNLSRLLLIVLGIFCLCSCSVKDESMPAQSADYQQGYADAMDQCEQLCEDAVQNYIDDIKHTDTYADVALLLQEDAVDYVREGCDWHPEDALCIVRAYEKGEKYYGSHLITEEDYQEAIRALCRFYSYFLDQEYK